MDGQKTAHWQTLDFLCVNVSHLTPFVTISGVKQSRLPVSQVIYSMMKWSSAHQKIVPLYNCQLFIFFLAGLAFRRFFLRMLRLSFAFSSMPLEKKKKGGLMAVYLLFFPHRGAIDIFLFCNDIFIFSFLCCWFIFDAQVHWHWEYSRPEAAAHWQILSSFPAWKVSKFQYI